jgi:alcohol dehydrogenase class IV
MKPMNPGTFPNDDFLVPRRIIFGWGRWREIGPLASQIGRRAFLVLGSRTLAASGFVAQLHDVLRENKVEVIELTTILHEPEVADVDRVVELVRKSHVRAGDLMIGVGGGSAMDLAKAVAALATNMAGASVQDYLEGVGRGLQLTEPPLPMIAVPTTAGTGSEATKNAVISSYAPPFKKSLRSDGMMPQAVVVDPELTVSLPPAITAHTGMDAITQLIESYLSRKARRIAQAVAAAGLRIALGRSLSTPISDWRPEAVGTTHAPASSLPLVEAVENGQSRPAREAMAQAALLSGMALANSGLGMAHGVAAALGVHVRAAHGLACALMLPVALAVNRPVCERQMAELARSTGLTHQPSDSAAADALVEAIEQLCQRVRVPRRLSELGVAQRHIPDLVRDSRGNSMDGNPCSLSDQELTRILEAHL